MMRPVWVFGTTALAGAAAGAVGAHLFDPDRGRARRARLSDQARAVPRRAGRRVATRIGRRARYTRGHVYGIVHNVSHAWGHAPADDTTLTQKVRSEVLGGRQRARLPISIDSTNGHVTLRGQLDDPAEIVAIERAVRKVRGVRKVINLLHLPGTPAPNKRAVLNVEVPQLTP